ncbi:Sorting nexin-16 [Lamellibrachia satsuma]|nr:Sorting nexin-16 [Lamellibrachia satsuma]
MPLAETIPCDIRRSPSPAQDAIEFLHGNMMASTPVAGDNCPTRSSSSLSDSTSISVLDSENDLSSVVTTMSHTMCGRVEVPIVGYEILEERSKFTVFKIYVRRFDENHQWFLFRRYTDFYRLNIQLRGLFPRFRLALPPKRWFRDNFDRNFLEDRQLALQAFLNNIVSHPDVSASEPVRRFFCFDDPPGPFDTLEESRALCELLEQQLHDMKLQLNERDAHVALLQEEMALQKAEINSLRKSLRAERITMSRRRSSPCHSDLPLHEYKTANYAQQRNSHVTPISHGRAMVNHNGTSEANF